MGQLSLIRSKLTALFFVVLVLVNAIGFVHKFAVLTQMSVNVLALFWVGSMVANRVQRTKPLNSNNNKSNSNNSTSNGEVIVLFEQSYSESISDEDSLKFPTLASLVLLSMYALEKLFGKFIIDLIVGSLVALITSVSTGLILQSYLPLPQSYRQFFLDHPLPRSLSVGLGINKLRLSKSRLLALLLGSVPVLLYYILDKFWILNNAFGLLFCLGAVRVLTPRSFRASLILLAMSTVYTYYWHYADTIRVAARIYQIPTKLLFEYFQDNQTHFRSISLADIILPAILLSMCLKFDSYKALTQKNKRNTNRNDLGAWPLHYFYMVWISYAGGLAYAYYYWTQTGLFNTPLLLFLAPAGLVGLFLLAVFNRDLKNIWRFQVSDTYRHTTQTSLKED